jgi:segregation and condensation protein A
MAIARPPTLPQLEAGPSAVRIEPDRRPDRAAHVSVGTWEGPLGLLLSLIEARQLDVLTVPLGSLAEAYLEALADLDEDRMGHVAAFITIASQLILIKSRAMLPRAPQPVPVGLEEDVDPEAELRARLLLYRAFRDAGQLLQDGALARVGVFRREPAAAAAGALAGARAPAPEPIDPGRLVEALDSLLRIVPPPPLPPETIPRTVTLTERAAVIRSALRGAGAVVLQELLKGVRDRVVVAVTFLAMLELMKRREIVVEQDRPWGPIVARRTSEAERLAAGAVVDEGEGLDETLADFA